MKVKGRGNGKVIALNTAERTNGLGIVAHTFRIPALRRLRQEDQ
jgi:hypothetical protein